MNRQLSQLPGPAAMTPALDAETPGRMGCPILVVQFFPDGSYDFQDELDGVWKQQGSSEESRCFLSSTAVGAVPDQLGTFHMSATSSRELTPVRQASAHPARQVSVLRQVTVPGSPAAAGGPAPPGPSYFQRMLGNSSAPKSPPMSLVLWAMSGSFLGLLVLSLLHYKVVVPNTEHLSLLWGSFGAQAVLLFAANQSPLTQPWNAVTGSVISSIIGVGCWKVFGELLPLADGIGQLIAPPVAVSLAIGAMMVTRSVHPPGGAFALIATIVPGRPRDAGFMFVLFPALVGVVVHLIIALLFNNLSSQPCRAYPVTWRFYQAPQLAKMDSTVARQLSVAPGVPPKRKSSELAKIPLTKSVH